jgi:dextranase
VTPTRAFFRPGESICLIVRSETAQQGNLTATIYHLGEVIAHWHTAIDGTEAKMSGSVPAEACRGYLAHVALDDSGQSCFTAFDVLDRWTQAPRYGFLYDFQPGRDPNNIQATIDHLLALHVNGLQFYDWQYRHDTLLPPADADTFIDPLGRPQSLQTVRTLIAAGHDRGMAAMPYTAIYAASPAFATAHPNWQLFDAQGQPFDFADGFLKIMNPCSGWGAHFVAECVRVLGALPFDGIHVDQYGEPRTGFDADGQPLDLPSGFANVLSGLREVVEPNKAVLFNLVHNWPAEAITDSPLDFWYSELWPPQTDMTVLWRTLNGNRSANRRPAVLAVYIPPTWESTIIAAQATILASGGSHISHGDHARYLSDPYFPKAGSPTPELARRLRQFADFAVAYEEALTFATDITESWEGAVLWNGQPLAPGQIVVRRTESRVFINILNNAGRWDVDLPIPAPMTGVQVSLPFPHPVRMWYASPAQPIPKRLDRLDTLPPIADWLLLGMEFEGDHG